jgi:hypothetical protein
MRLGGRVAVAEQRAPDLAVVADQQAARTWATP